MIELKKTRWAAEVNSGSTELGFLEWLKLQQAMGDAHHLNKLPLMEAMWWFIENVDEHHPLRNSLFFDLRHRVREAQESL